MRLHSEALNLSSGKLVSKVSMFALSGEVAQFAFKLSMSLALKFSLTRSAFSGSWLLRSLGSEVWGEDLLSATSCASLSARSLPVTLL